METNNSLYRCLRNEHVDEKSMTLLGLFFLGQIKHLLVHAIKAKFLYEEFLKHQILKSALCFLFGGSEHQILSRVKNCFLSTCICMDLKIVTCMYIV